MNGFIQIAHLLLLVNFVYSFPNGAPLSQCGNMMPGHHSMPIQTPSPFSIRVTADQARSLSVTIVSENPLHFKGFLIEARTDAQKYEAIGTWMTNVRKTKTINCFGRSHSAVTHNLHDDDESEEDDDDDDDDDHKNHHHKRHHKHFENITFTWYPPREFDEKRVYFIATIVKKFSEIYTDVITSYKWMEDIKLRIQPKHKPVSRLVKVEDTTTVETTTISTANLTTVTTPYADLSMKEKLIFSERHDQGKPPQKFNDVLKSTPYRKLKEYYMWLKRTLRSAEREQE